MSVNALILRLYINIYKSKYIKSMYNVYFDIFGSALFK